MEVASEVEDYLFLGDLSRRISLLLIEDDEDPVEVFPWVCLQAFSRPNYLLPPSHLLQEPSCRRERKGTGVFIPRTAHLRRKHVNGRFNSFSPKSHIHSPKYGKTRLVSQVSYKNSFSPKKEP